MQRQNRNMNTPFQRFRQQRDNNIKRLYKEGYYTIEEISRYLGCGITTINRALKGMRNRRGQNAKV